MSNKIVSGDCENCESTFVIDYVEEMVSQELPEHCPFCGEVVDKSNIKDDYIEDDDDLDDDEDVYEWTPEE